MAANEDEPEEIGPRVKTPTCLLSPPPAKSFRPEPSAATAAGRFKGVVLQYNGNWGAQIYAHHQRIWLGTFKSERSAAVAYDRAATKLHAADATRNFPFLSPLEPLFQNLHSTESVLAMIRDGSYDPKLAEFLRSFGAAAPESPGGAAAVRELFQKELTPSDVGKLNRLVIPKKYAIKFFPRIVAAASSRGEVVGGAAAAEGVMLEFKDFQGRRWEFRYCYWKSSQSFVFTKGWNKFVKTNQLRPKDAVTFYAGEERGGLPSSFLIDASRQGGAGGEPVLHTFLLGNVNQATEDDELAGEEEEEEEDEEEDGGGAEAALRLSTGDVRLRREGREAEPKKAFRLFGVQISGR